MLNLISKIKKKVLKQVDVVQPKNKFKFIDRMKGQDYIDQTRAYLDYLEEHLNNVGMAFDELSEACNGKDHWVGDDCTWHQMRHDVINHDLSKFSKEEFVQYRANFFPVSGLDKLESGFKKAWENHKNENHHHHETAENYLDIVHMVIDWMAMSYKFGGDPRDYYNKIKPTMSLKADFHDFINKLFTHLEEYRIKKN